MHFDREKGQETLQFYWNYSKKTPITMKQLGVCFEVLECLREYRSTVGVPEYSRSTGVPEYNWNNYKISANEASAKRYSKTPRTPKTPILQMILRYSDWYSRYSNTPEQLAVPCRLKYQYFGLFYSLHSKHWSNSSKSSSFYEYSKIK